MERAGVRRLFYWREVAGKTSPTSGSEIAIVTFGGVIDDLSLVPESL